MRRISNRHCNFIERLESRTLLSVAEPNNTFATAVPVGGGKAFGGTATFIDAVSDTDTIDIYKLPTDAAGNLSLTLRTNLAGARLTLVHDANRNGIEDRGEQISTLATTISIPGTIAIALKQSSPIENYFIKVSRILGNTAYSLNIVYDTAGNTGATARLLQ